MGVFFYFRFNLFTHNKKRLFCVPTIANFVFSFYFIFLIFYLLLDNTGLGSSESFEMINNNETQDISADNGNVGGK
jgi:hypothetical protein